MPDKTKFGAKIVSPHRRKRRFQSLGGSYTIRSYNEIDLPGVQHKFKIAMTFVDRSLKHKENYADRTLRGLDLISNPLTKEHGIFISHVDKTDYTEELSQYSQLYYPEENLGQVSNMHRVLEWFSQDCDYGIYLEDDIEVAVNFFKEINRWIICDVPDAEIMSLIYPFPFASKVQKKHVIWPHSPQFFGMCGAIFTSNFCQQYLDSGVRKEANHYGCGGDIWIGKFASEMGYKVYAHSPNIIHHIGRDSSIDDRYFHSSFIGTETDAIAAY